MPLTPAQVKQAAMEAITERRDVAWSLSVDPKSSEEEKQAHHQCVMFANSIVLRFQSKLSQLESESDGEG